MKVSITKLVQESAEKLRSIYQNQTTQQQTAWWLLEKLTHKSEAELIAQETIDLSVIENNMLQEWIYQHVHENKPLQYILGSVPFLDLTIHVEPPILIPRPETEEWTYNLIQQLKTLPEKNITILDIGCGSGCIALALAQALPQATVYASDISQQALNLTQKNSTLNNIPNIKPILSNIFQAMPRNLFFDLIVSNPPYITPDEWKTLDESVKKWEDKRALSAPQEGLAILVKIINYAQHFLKENHKMKQHNIPQLVLEIGYLQAEAVTTSMEKAGFKNITVHKDLFGKDRVVSGSL